MVDGPASTWTDRWRSDRALAVYAVLAALMAAGVFSYLAYLRPPQSHLWGDEGTYVGMTASLARDFDLAFAEPDRSWALERGTQKGVAVILQRTAGGITYSKPLLYPLLAALPYKLFGEPGMVLANALALALGVFFAWLYLRRMGGGGHLYLTLVVFFGYAAVVPYVLWRMSESLQVGLALGGLVLCCGALTDRQSTDCQLRGDGRFDGLLDHRAAPWLGGVLLGLLTSMRTSNAALIVGAIFACLMLAGWKRAATVGAGAAVALLVILGVSLIGLGTVSPYTAERSSFNAAIGYPAGPEGQQALIRFDEHPATHRFHLEPTRVSLYSAYYFVVGRHTGLLAYFPLALGLIFLLARRPNRLGLAMLGTTLALTLFYLVYTPNNYFGGSTFLGNRYFLVTYPALLIGLTRLPSPKLLLGTLAVGLVFGASAVASVRSTSGVDSTSQSHTAAWAFRRLPYESTAAEIQGQKSRFWSQDFVRFTDSFATVQRNRFTLHADRPYTELMIASRKPRSQMVLLVRPAAGIQAINWKDWARSGSIRINQKKRARRRGIVAFETASPWRRHPFWWENDDNYEVRVLELGLVADSGESAEVYYLGSSAAILDSARRVVAMRRLPSKGIAGRHGRARIQVRNTSKVVWSPDGVLPVMIGYRIDSREATVARGKQPIPQPVRPGEVTVFEMTVDWPEEPGRYRLVIDLALHPVFWFADRIGKPLAETVVDVLPSEPGPGLGRRQAPPLQVPQGL